MYCTVLYCCLTSDTIHILLQVTTDHQLPAAARSRNYREQKQPFI